MTPSTLLVTGATGTLGRPTVDRLREAGHEVRSLSRTAGPGRVVGDLLSGQGIDEAARGVDVLVHLATTKGKGEVEAAETAFAAARRAHVGHVIAISIVGIDEIPLGYYRSKVRIEQILARSGQPHTILRATQFHDFAKAFLTGQRMLPLLFAPSIRIQPIAVDEVASRLADVSVGEPAGRVPDIGGPQVLTGRELASSWKQTTGSRRPIVPLSLPGAIFAALKRGAGCVPGEPYGRETFADYLANTLGNR